MGTRTAVAVRCRRGAADRRPRAVRAVHVCAATGWPMGPATQALQREAAFIAWVPSTGWRMRSSKVGPAHEDEGLYLPVVRWRPGSSCACAPWDQPRDPIPPRTVPDERAAHSRLVLAAGSHDGRQRDELFVRGAAARRTAARRAAR